MAKFYLTTPIYYVNARPHIGHTYTTIVADTIARYRRMRGDEVVFLTGTDEHGQKIERSAKAAGTAPQKFADRISAEYRSLWNALDLRYDRFIRTTEWRHERAVHNLLCKARDAGYIYKGHYEGFYCVSDELYVDEPTSEGKCPICGRPLEKIREENYFFKLSEFAGRLMELYEKQPDFVQPEARRNEVMAFVRGGLRDLSVSRTSIKWGIPWPDDDRHVVYVWYDALTSYMSGVGYGDDEVQFEKMWPADLHLIGKEILRFHAVYWPAFLMAADEPLPKQVLAHGWWTFEGEKMSKSLGNIKLAQPIAQVLGIDALRYFLLREMVFGQDGSFSYDALLTRYNSDLANGLGNFASRTLAMIEQYFQSVVPAAPQSSEPPALAEKFRTHQREALGHFDKYQFSMALQGIWELIAAGDAYLTQQKPWTLAADSARRNDLAAVLYNAAETLRVVAVLAHPVLPHVTQKIWAQLGQRSLLAEERMDNLEWGGLQPGTQIEKTEALFPRVKKEEAVERMDQMEEEIRAEGISKPAVPVASPGAAAQAAPAPGDGRIGIEDFTKVEMRVGEVKSAERVPNTDKLLKIMVDIGTEVRQVLAGIAEFYEPEKLVGRKVVVVVNLAPRKMRGLESNGMIVAASAGPEGRPVLAGFLEDVPVGARLK
jgi:methionyl-tRNA synthetase